MVLVTAAVYFAAVYLGLRMKLRILAGHVLRASKRVFGIPDFRPGRWDQTVSLQPDPGTEEALGATEHVAGPTIALRSIIFWGKACLNSD